MIRKLLTNLSTTLIATSIATSTALASTPYIDVVESALRSLAPGSEGLVWERTTNNSIAGYGPYESQWLLQTPNCWGDAACANAPGLQTLADAIYRDISAAEKWVDITTLIT